MSRLPRLMSSETGFVAVREAQGWAMTPSEVTDIEFKNLREHFSDGQIIEIAAVVSMFGIPRDGMVTDPELGAETFIENRPEQFVSLK